MMKTALVLNKIVLCWVTLIRKYNCSQSIVFDFQILRERERNVLIHMPKATAEQLAR